jgi:hypothetical protein
MRWDIIYFFNARASRVAKRKRRGSTIAGGTGDTEWRKDSGRLEQLIARLPPRSAIR